jgi:hypothetical protein
LILNSFSLEFFLKMLSDRVHFRTGFPLRGENFPHSSFCSGGIQFFSAGNKMSKTTADQHPRGALCVSRIPQDQKNGFPRCSAYLLNTTGAKSRQVAPRESISTTLEQIALREILLLEEIQA